jgi:hypothetical protein
MHTAVDRLSRAGLPGLIALLVVSLTPVSAATAQTMLPPPVRSVQFFGIIKRAPARNIGLWLIGMETIESDQFTEFDDFYGPLVVSACVRVDVRRGRALRIVSVRQTVCSPPPAKRPATN